LTCFRDFSDHMLVEDWGPKSIHKECPKVIRSHHRWNEVQRFHRVQSGTVSTNKLERRLQEIFIHLLPRLEINPKEG
jgi:hypothetical protein